jgi:hypothetical protein
MTTEGEEEMGSADVRVAKRVGFVYGRLDRALRVVGERHLDGGRRLLARRRAGGDLLAQAFEDHAAKGMSRCLSCMRRLCGQRVPRVFAILL